MLAAGWVVLGALPAAATETAPPGRPCDCVTPSPQRTFPVKDDPAIVHPPARAFWWAADGGSGNLVAPLLEIPLLNGLFWSGAFLGGKYWAEISIDSMSNNVLDSAWVWDHDDFATNAFGHPYQGALAFTAARSAGLGFWASIPFAVGSSAMWELLMETVPPSKNDLITTSIGGIMFGEVIHRFALVLLDSDEPTIARSVIASVLEPAGAFNRYFLGRKDGDFLRLLPRYARLRGGVAANVDNYNDIDGTRFDVANRLEAVVGLELVYGMPGDPRSRYEQPFDHFVLFTRASFAPELYASIFLRGMVFGSGFTWDGGGGLLGVFGGYDFSNPNTMRVSTVSVGLGGAIQQRVTQDVLVSGSLTLSGVPFGAGGGLADAVETRDYHYGPGAQQVLEVNVVRQGVGRISLSARAYQLSGAFLGEGFETILYGTAIAEIQLVGNHGVGMEAFVADRSASFGSAEVEMRQRATQIRFFWTYTIGTGLSAVLNRQ